MKVTKKKCKGTGNCKGRGCGSETYNRRYGLCNSCFAKWLYQTPEGLEKVLKAQLKATKPRRDLELATKLHKDRVGLTTLIKSVVTVCHEYIRLRDKYKPCISCGTSWNTGFQAGHYKKAEKFTTIKLHEHNINGQCQQCNLRKDGNESEYALNLPKRIGEYNFKELTRLAELDHSIDFHWEREKLKEVRVYYKEKINVLKQLE